jgi:hypothetical protein
MSFGIEQAKADRRCPMPLPIAVGDQKVPWVLIVNYKLPTEVQDAISRIIPQGFTFGVVQTNLNNEKNATDYLVFYNNIEVAQSNADLRQHLMIFHFSPGTEVSAFSVYQDGITSGFQPDELAYIRPEDIIIYRSQTGAVYLKTIGYFHSNCWEDIVSWNVDRFTNHQIPFFTSDGFNYPVNSARYPADIQTVNNPIGDGWKIDQKFQDCISYASGQKPCSHLGEDWNGVGGGNTDLGYPVFAVSRGEVIFADDAGIGWNGVVVLRHRPPNIGESDIFSFYGHLNINKNIKRADGSSVRTLDEILTASSPGHIVEVEKGQLIGYIGPGPEGEFSHLHFEMIADPVVAYDKHQWVGYRVLSGKQDQWKNPSSFIASHRSSPYGFRIGQDWSRLGIDPSLFKDAYEKNSGANTLGEPIGIVSYMFSQSFQNGELFERSIGEKVFGVLNPLIAKVRILSPPRMPGEFAELWGYNTTDISNLALGQPTQDVTGRAAVSSFGTVYKYQNFENGALEFHQTGKYVGEVFEVHGEIFKRWLELGHAPSSFGLPISDEYEWSGMRRSDFEGGYITWTSSDGAKVVLN